MIIKPFASFRLSNVGGQVQVDIGPKAKVADALEALFGKHPELRELMMTEAGTTTLPFVQVMLQGRLVRDQQGLQTPLGDADTMAIFPPIAGG